MKLAIAFTVSILSLTTLATPAAAQETAFSASVQFADLDLDREAGIARLYLRIKGAARRVCDQQAEEQLATQTYPVCVKDAMATAVARLDHPRLTDYFAQQVGKPAKTASAGVAAR